MRRATASILLALAAILVFALPAGATRNWCLRDPIVSLNGQPVQIWIAIPAEYEPAVNGPIEVRIFAPKNVSRKLLYVDDGFNGHGEDVRLEDDSNLRKYGDGSFDAIVRVKAPLDSNTFQRLGGDDQKIPLRLTITTNGELLTRLDGTIE
ncbi:MAG: hypothetical protein ACRD1H_17800, partial [Vicinamibacterales bacterium]